MSSNEKREWKSREAALKALRARDFAYEVAVFDGNVFDFGCWSIDIECFNCGLKEDLGWRTHK